MANFVCLRNLDKDLVAAILEEKVNVVGRKANFVSVFIQFTGGQEALGEIWNDENIREEPVEFIATGFVDYSNLDVTNEGDRGASTVSNSDKANMIANRVGNKVGGMRRHVCRGARVREPVIGGVDTKSRMMERR